LVTLAERGEDNGALAAAHELAARVSLARNDADTANAHAEAAETAAPALPVRAFIHGRLLFDAGLYADAVTELQQAVEGGEPSVLPELHLTLGEALARLERYDEAEVQYRDEITLFPRSLQAYVSLATLYRATNREAEVEAVLNELVTSTPTPEGYALAARAWTDLGDRARANALRADARARFRGDPSLALLETVRR
jgi:predicted Zn-dependent protease